MQINPTFPYTICLNKLHYFLEKRKSKKDQVSADVCQQMCQPKAALTCNTFANFCNIATPTVATFSIDNVTNMMSLKAGLEIGSLGSVGAEVTTLLGLGQNV